MSKIVETREYPQRTGMIVAEISDNGYVHLRVEGIAALGPTVLRQLADLAEGALAQSLDALTRGLTSRSRRSPSIVPCEPGGDVRVPFQGALTMAIGEIPPVRVRHPHVWPETPTALIRG